jgi:restriction system protein
MATKCLAGGAFLWLFPMVLGSALPKLHLQESLVSTLRPLTLVLVAVGAGLLLLRLLMRPKPAQAETPAETQAEAAPVKPQGAPSRKTAETPPGAALQPQATPTPTPAPAPAPAPARSATEAPERPTAWGPEVFRVIEWRRFEALVEALFAQAGFITRSQSHGSDGGVDIWLHSKNQPDGTPVSIVQCKHWSDNKPVGVDKIRELRGVMASHDIRRGQFACTARYTDAAREFARDNQINLLDGAALLELIAKRNPEQQQALLDVALDGEYWKPTCVNCGVKMVFRGPSSEGKKRFWGCLNFPKCRAKIYVRNE